MPDLSTIPPELSPQDKIQFTEHHRVALASGDYTISVKQTVSVKGEEHFFEGKRAFSVYGERFSLNPQLVHAMFPPLGSRGDFWHLFPHVILNRSTLPWERTPLAHDTNPDRDPPWLMLLLLDEAEAPTPQVMSLEELKSHPQFSNLELESGQHWKDQVTVIDLPQNVFSLLLAGSNSGGSLRETLHYATHVRHVEYSRSSGEELVIIIGNRLPNPNARSIVHLVSLEARINSSGEFELKDNSSSVRLISLLNWSFFSIDPEKTFKGLLEGLNSRQQNSSSFRLPLLADQSFANAFLQNGFVPLPHSLRQGDRTVSWYHGPLLPQKLNTEGVSLPARAADQLIIFDQKWGMFDVSYAAAWELGRMLMLENKRLALLLFNWKRKHAHSIKATRHLVDYGYHLPFKQQQSQRASANLPNQHPEDSDYFPDELWDWFDELSLLSHIPFNYLVPDEQLLPPESLRFFAVDRIWIECLHDGAFSIGRVLESDVTVDQTHRENIKAASDIPELSGFLLRSEVVSGWPGLLVDGYDRAIAPDDPAKALRNDSHLDETLYPKLKCCRMERLGKDVLLCLFEGSVKMIDVHLSPETLHFGLDVPDEDIKNDVTKLIKKLRQDDGETSEQPPLAMEKLIGSKSRVINFKELAKQLYNQLPTDKPASTSSNSDAADSDAAEKPLFENTLNPAKFALEMVAGVDLVRFVRP